MSCFPKVSVKRSAYMRSKEATGKFAQYSSCSHTVFFSRQCANQTSTLFWIPVRKISIIGDHKCLFKSPNKSTHIYPPLDIH